MTYLVISDLHGSLQAAQSIASLKKLHHADTILGCGDFLYHGPRNNLPEDYQPKEVITLLNAEKENIIAVRGNCDAEVDQMVLQFPITADYNTIPFHGHTLFITHGHVYAPESCPSSLKEGDLFLSGHTHIPTAKQENGIYFLNPGSMSLPKGGFAKSYGVLEETSFTVYTLDQQVLLSIAWK